MNPRRAILGLVAVAAAMLAAGLLRGGDPTPAGTVPDPTGSATHAAPPPPTIPVLEGSQAQASPSIRLLPPIAEGAAPTHGPDPGLVAVDAVRALLARRQARVLAVVAETAATSTDRVRVGALVSAPSGATALSEFIVTLAAARVMTITRIGVST